MELVEIYMRSYFEDMDALNCLRPDISPRASGHIIEQIELVKILLEKGCYVVRTSREANPAVPLSYEYILSYRIADLKFEYWYPKASIFKKRSIRRRMRLDCFFFLSEAQSPVVLWSKWMQIQRQDLVPAGAEEALKDEIFSDRTILRDKNRWIEILVVVGVIGSMIYTLF